MFIVIRLVSYQVYNVVNLFLLVFSVAAAIVVVYDYRKCFFMFFDLFVHVLAFSALFF